MTKADLQSNYYNRDARDNYWGTLGQINLLKLNNKTSLSDVTTMNELNMCIYTNRIAYKRSILACRPQ